MEAKVRRGDWEHNNSVISNALLRYYTDHNRRPTNTKLAELTGLSLSSVNRHFEHIDRAEIFAKEQDYLAVYASELFYYIMLSASKGNARSQELALQLAFGWTRPKPSARPQQPVQSASEDEEVDLDMLIDFLIRERDAKNLLKQ